MSGRLPRHAIVVLVVAGVLVTSSGVCQAGLFSCFRRKREAAAIPVQSAPMPITTNFAPTATCGAAQCQQTVVQYVPQIAFRTAWAPVPVTTYQTSTSINPTTGLPMTCTRPCTSYTYQARRVPYTTFRPVYTTVPVTLPATNSAAAPTAMGWGSNAPVAGYTPGTAGFGPANANLGCATCPGGATPAPYPVYPTEPGYGTVTAPSVNPETGAPSGEADVYATPWQPAPSAGALGSAPPVGSEPADTSPSLNPEQSYLQRVPPPATSNGSVLHDSFRRNENSQGSGTGGYESNNSGDPYPSQYPGTGVRPEVEQPGASTGGPNTPNSRAVLDLQRATPPSSNPPAGQDQTARSAPQTRYAAVPIRWPVMQTDRKKALKRTPEVQSTPNAPSARPWDDTGWIPVR